METEVISSVFTSGSPYIKHFTFFYIEVIPLCCSTKQNILQSKHNNIFNYVKFATCFVYSNQHQADISVHGHGMFSATVWDPTLFIFAV